MTSPMCQDAAPFREWAPLTSLLQKIPSKIQIGLFMQDINFTCIDTVAEFIAIGTNHGIIYWYNRKTEEFETLGCESINNSITCVKVVSTVDYMVAAGDNMGAVTIFQIPKELPDSLPETFKPKKKKQVDRFNISGLHKASVTAVEWTKNGMKLFSGDQNGLVVLTEMDFYMHLSKSTELLNEKYAIVQLSCHNGLLIISTLFRTIIVDRNQNNKIVQIGQKERKVFGKFGAVFSKNKIYTQEIIIYTSRPGLRIWQANKHGIVLKTLILKEAIKTAPVQVELLNPASDNFRRKSQKDLSFGIILPFFDDLLVTFNEDIIYIINPINITITSMITNLRKVTDVTCSGDEMFILEGERNIIRVANYPETMNFNAEKNETLIYSTPVAEFGRPITSRLSEITSKLKLSTIMPAIPLSKVKSKNLIQSTVSILPPVVIGVDTTSIINAEEAVEVPPIIPLELKTNLVTEIDIIKKHFQNRSEKMSKSVDRKDIFQRIGEQDFEDVVYTPKKKDTKLFHSVSQITSKIIQNSNNPITNVQSETNILINCNSSNHLAQNLENHCTSKIEGNLESIKKEVQDKERLLSHYLNLDLTTYMDKGQNNISKSNSFGLTDQFSWITDVNQDVQAVNSVEEDLKKEIYKVNLCKLSKNGECNQKTYKTGLIDDKLWHDKTELEDKRISETHFNALSKEFVKSTICQDNDDWILLG